MNQEMLSIPRSAIAAAGRALKFTIEELSARLNQIPADSPYRSLLENEVMEMMDANKAMFSAVPTKAQRDGNSLLIAAAPDLLEALQAEERHRWAIHNWEGLRNDPLREGLLAAKIEVERTCHESNSLRKAALAKAEGRAE